MPAQPHPSSAAHAFAAQLRIYHPVSDYPDAASPAASTPLPHAPASHAVSSAPVFSPADHLAPTPQGAGAPAPCLDHEQEHALRLRLDGQLYLCPSYPALQQWECLQHLRQQLPASAVWALVADSQAEHISAQYRRWRWDHPEAVGHILTAAWHVPLPWLSLFSPGERVHTGAGGHSGTESGSGIVDNEIGGRGNANSRHGRSRRERSMGGGSKGPQVVYRTRLSCARRRVARALRVLRASIDVPTSQGTEELAQWLTQFAPLSYVELDFGRLAAVQARHFAQASDGVAQMQELVATLREGKERQANAVLAQLQQQWRSVRQYEHAN